MTVYFIGFVPDNSVDLMQMIFQVPDPLVCFQLQTSNRNQPTLYLPRTICILANSQSSTHTII